MSAMNVLLIGATGLVGRELLTQLATEPACIHITVLARRQLPAPVPPKVESHVVDFDHLESAAEFAKADAVFCALGTTIRQAGSQQRFREVDFGYPLAVAKLALAQGARHFLLVSALGADTRSRVFYNRVKGDLEVSVSALGYRSVTIARPSLLLGHREEFRLGERVFARIGWMVPRRWKPVPAVDVARVLVRAAVEDAAGVRVIESREI